MKDAVVLTRAAAKIQAALQAAESTVPRIGSCSILLIAGASGSGKTVLLDQYATVNSRAFINVPPDPSAGLLLDLIFQAARGEPHPFYRQRDNLACIIEEIRVQGSPPLIFDNADRLAAKANLVDLLRHIGDCAGSTLIFSCLPGPRGFREMLSQPRTAVLDAVAARVAWTVELETASLEDAQSLADELSDVHFSRAVVEHLYRRGLPNARRIVADLARAERIGRAAGMNGLDLETWLSLTGECASIPETPAARRALPARKNASATPVGNELREGVKAA